MRSKNNLRKTQVLVKNLILYDSVWEKRNKIKEVKKIADKALRRLEIYRGLVRNSFRNLMINIYPNTYFLLKKDWDKLLSKYIEKFPPSSPMLNRVAESFHIFLKKEKNITRKYPFINELALYEWLEVEIYEKEITNNLRYQGAHTNNERLFLNPIHEITSFQYPITEIIKRIQRNEHFRTLEKSMVNILIYRDPITLKVRSMELSSGILLYLSLLKKGYSTTKITHSLANYYNINSKEQKSFKNETKRLIWILRKNKILLKDYPKNHLIPK